MTDYTAITTAYLSTWNLRDDAERAGLVSRFWTEDARYVDPMAEATGAEQITTLIATVQAQFPDYRFSLLGAPDGHHDRLRFQWGLGPVDAEPVVIGFDVIALDDEGRISDVSGFLDRVPA
jgi:SnoaL-like domain